MLLWRENSAGRYAQDRYKLGLKRWRKKVRWLFVLCFAPFVLLGVAAMLYSQDTLAWIGGVLFGLVVGAWSWIRIDPPGYVENWNTGAEGERKTARTLRPLEGLGWRTSHDIQTGYGNYDHVVVGPGGVFLLETKYLGGVVQMRNGVPWVRQKLYPDQAAPYGDIRRQALGSAARLKGEIEELSGCRTWVQAVVVFWSEFPEGFVKNGKCVFIEGSRLSEWLQSQPSQLNAAEVEEIGSGVSGIAEERRRSSLTQESPELSPA